MREDVAFDKNRYTIVACIDPDPSSLVTTALMLRSMIIIDPDPDNLVIMDHDPGRRELDCH